MSQHLQSDPVGQDSWPPKRRKASNGVVPPARGSTTNEKRMAVSSSWRRVWLFLACATIVDCWATIPGGSRPRATSSTPLPTIEESSSSAPSSSAAASSSKWPQRPSKWTTNNNNNDNHDNKNNRKNQPTIVLEDQFVTPERDSRSYRLIQLSNNLIALLVSDGMTEGVGVEAASVHVKAGHFDDTVPGLAHFHEHMLFLGNAKYPDEDEYEAYLSQNGGFSNAYTDMEDTNYYCSISTDAAAAESHDYFGNNDDDRPSSVLHGALDRLAQFFIAPSFNPDAVERELRAIDSEYVNGKSSDTWRNYQLLKSVADVTHPFHKFGCGNYETLSSANHHPTKIPDDDTCSDDDDDDTAAAAARPLPLLRHLQQFWSDYYQTYNMRLAVVGHANLDVLQRMVEDTFGQIPPSNGPVRHVRNVAGQTFPREDAVYNNGVPAFGPTQLGVVRHVIPYAEARRIKITFATPPLDDPVLKISKPYRAFSHALGHEAPGSLHAVLNEEDLVTSLTSGFALETSDFSLFSLSMSLTAKGMEQRQKVLDLVFQWIALLRRQSHEHVWRAYHDELRDMGLTNFRFRENSDPVDFCSAASELLFTEAYDDPSRLLISTNDVAEYDPVIAEAFFARISPHNCFITVTNSDFVVNNDDNSAVDDGGDGFGEWKTEKWYGAKYSERRLSAEQLAAWANPTAIDRRLSPPSLNIYIPTDFSLRCDDDNDDNAESSKSGSSASVSKQDLERPPTILIDEPKLRLWHKMDQRWRVPKTHIKAAFASPTMYQTPRSMTLNRIFQRVLDDDLNSYIYDASLAGCRHRVTSTPTGYRISVQGYSEKLPFLLETLTARIFSLIDEMKKGHNTVLQEKFNKARDNLLRETKNYRLDAPHEVANYNARLLLEERVWYLDNYIDAMEGAEAERFPLTLQECADAVAKTFQTSKCEALCMGNINEAEAQTVAAVLRRRFLESSPAIKDVELPTFRSMLLPTKDEASRIFGKPIGRSIPLIYQELAFSKNEENNAVEVLFQVGNELELGYEGVAIIDLLSHMAYNSAFSALRTKEQLGYVVSAHARKTTGGGWAIVVVVQGNTALPEVMEERIEAWLETYHEELRNMDVEDILQEAAAVAAQYMEIDTKLSQEIHRAWGEILGSESMTDPRLRVPDFERTEKLAASLSNLSGEELKDRLLTMFGQHIASTSPQRRALSSRVYRHDSSAEYEASRRSNVGVLTSYADIRHVKHFLTTMPDVAYWRRSDGF